MGPTPPSAERKRPASVAASTTWPDSLYSIWRTAVACAVTPGYAPERMTGPSHVAPPSSEWKKPGTCTSNGSPRPSSRLSGFPGFIARAPMDNDPSVSVIGSQCGPRVASIGAVASNVFHTPPPEVARYTTSGLVGCTKMVRGRPESTLK